MDRPHVLMLTPDADLVAVCCEQLGDRAEVDVCRLPDDVRPRLAQRRAMAFVADFRGILDGGHLGDRLLEDVQLDFEPPLVVMITDRDCPEPLERRSACTPLVHLRGEVVPADLAALLLGRLGLSRPQPSVPAVADPLENVAAGVLEGVTRRFETRAPQLKQMLEDLAIAAVHDVTILLIGETGSGKTFLSNLIHEASPRRSEPFLHVACGALPRELIEGELFGHAKGAFTSAHADKEGKFVAAGKGTVLLDEIDVLGPEQQVKLLRVIETGEFEPVGSNRTLKSKARLVVASNLDLQPLVEQGRFRPDLYYRLNMLKFDIPPLRQRKVDIVPLAKRFVEKFSEKHGLAIARVDDRLFDALLSYPWPGNVRELEHVIQRAVIYCRGGVLTEQNLPPHILAGNAGPANDPSVRLSVAPAIDPTLGQQIALTEKDIIEQTLFRNNFSRTRTARELGISRVTLYNKMRKYEMFR
jgi:DNA-binding NtrC family response regulator